MEVRYYRVWVGHWGYMLWGQGRAMGLMYYNARVVQWGYILWGQGVGVTHYGVLVAQWGLIFGEATGNSSKLEYYYLGIFSTRTSAQTMYDKNTVHLQLLRTQRLRGCPELSSLSRAYTEYSFFLPPHSIPKVYL